MIVKLLLTNFLFIALCSIINAQQLSPSKGISDVNFLIGKWEADFGNFKYYEDWQNENEKIIGSGYRIKEGKKFDGEKLLLMNIHGYISYIAVVGKQQPILFALVESGDSNYVFENKEHDFPQQIIYQFINNNFIKVFVKGILKGESVKHEYNLTRINE